MTSATPENDLLVQRQRLALLCALDRAGLRLALRSAPSGDDASSAGEDMQDALQVAAILPGSVGRWSRRLALGLRLFRLVRAPKS